MAEQGAVLLVEDNEKLSEINRRALAAEGYDVRTARSLAEAREYLSAQSPDVILLDVMLPDGDGIDFCGEIRGETDAHILFLSSRTEHEDRINGLNRGGDDYITKPYRLDELLARVAAAMRRRGMARERPPERVVIRGALTLDTVAGRAFLRGEDILLTPKEFHVLLVLVQNEGKPLTPSALYQSVWGWKETADLRTIQVHISNLRRKLHMRAEGEMEIELIERKRYVFRMEAERDTGRSS